MESKSQPVIINKRYEQRVVQKVAIMRGLDITSSKSSFELPNLLSLREFIDIWIKACCLSLQDGDKVYIRYQETKFKLFEVANRALNELQPALVDEDEGVRVYTHNGTRLVRYNNRAGILVAKSLEEYERRERVLINNRDEKELGFEKFENYLDRHTTIPREFSWGSKVLEKVDTNL